MRLSVLSALERNDLTIGATTFKLGDQQCIGPPNFLAILFKKQEISQQVVTRMHSISQSVNQSINLYRAIVQRRVLQCGYANQREIS